ncbi:Bacterial type II secretion system protein F domain protein [Rosistilla carotiformis]|uniref:Bacterial type II secretion system protein F domain protein n=1 Tax=Rosistilla carotiformis TaxID=2528017 RepID=A0A518JLQ4_9BACT|nr:type II secretion system F family protein [Rosistilla carotiformis]QDV66468.1 Bacterial type II secretion system protein F domain protein [Rosistilla carotiformis]
MGMMTCLLTAAAVALLCYTVLDISTSRRVVDPQGGRFEQQRREALRKANAAYRYGEPLIDQWNTIWPSNAPILAATDEHLHAAGIREPWKPQEYLNVKRLEGIGIAVGCFLTGLFILEYSIVASLFIGLIAFSIQQSVSARTLKSQAIVRQMRLKRRFAGVIELMALMMEVGAGFQEALQTAARESQGTPLGEELGLVEKEIAMGALRSKALLGFADRNRDPDMTEVIMSINEGEELGTPVTTILRRQADQMRQKRSQWAEKAAEESQVAIVFPAMLIMVACLLIVVAPFVLSVLPGI